jgi:hypothetical protein
MRSVRSRSLRVNLVVKQSLTSKDVKKEAEEVTALETVTRRQLVNTQQTDKT